METRLIYANYIEQGNSNNDRFNLDIEKNINNRSYTYWLLRETLLEYSIELNTPDINVGKSVVFELHMNVASRKTHLPCYVLLLETEEIYPLNKSRKLLSRYRKIFSWNDDLVNGKRSIKINFPNKPILEFKLGWDDRSKFCCVIAANKSCLKWSKNDLYSERVNAIRWFERNAPDRFDLYGGGWEAPAHPSGLLGRIWTKILPYYFYFYGKNAFSSYRGRIDNKYETLIHYKFSICYENVRNLPGYITEKIFDCFFAGCVPIYWGASNITDYIPRECFIDKRNFESYDSLYIYLDQMTEVDYLCYQNSIHTYLRSSQAKKFYSNYFVDNVVAAILTDLKNIEENRP